MTEACGQTVKHSAKPCVRRLSHRGRCWDEDYAARERERDRSRKRVRSDYYAARNAKNYADGTTRDYRRARRSDASYREREREQERARLGQVPRGSLRPADSPAWIYVLLDSQEKVIYVGQTVNPPKKRAADHKRGKPWGSLISSVKYREVLYGELDSREMSLIHSAHPFYNVQCKLCPGGTIDHRRTPPVEAGYELLASW